MEDDAEIFESYEIFNKKMIIKYWLLYLYALEKTLLNKINRKEQFSLENEKSFKLVNKNSTNK